MAGGTERHEITRRRIVHEIDGMRHVPVRRGLIYREGADGRPLTMDVYYPPNQAVGARTPAVVFVNGYSDVGARAVLGCPLKEMQSFVSWGQLIAASGLAAVVYETDRDPAADAESIIAYLQTNAGALGIDARRLGLWACSGHGPNALSLLMQNASRNTVSCAVFCYSFMFDVDGRGVVVAASQKFGFVNPVSGIVDDLPRGTPLFVARAGQDDLPGLNDTIDRFVSHGLRLNLPLTVVNHPTGPHAFDILQDSNTSRQVIQQIVKFLQLQLRS